MAFGLEEARKSKWHWDCPCN